MYKILMTTGFFFLGFATALTAILAYNFYMYKQALVEKTPSQSIILPWGKNVNCIVAANFIIESRFLGCSDGLDYTCQHGGCTASASQYY